jgi:hypothetical protein
VGSTGLQASLCKGLQAQKALHSSQTGALYTPHALNQGQELPQRMLSP